MTTTAMEEPQEPFACRGCGHTIPGGQRSLADIPGQKPLHIICYECEPARLCYPLRFASHTPFTAQEKVECASCVHPIPEGEDVLRASIFVGDAERWRETQGKAGGGIAAALNTPAPKPASFGDLSAKMKGKFRTAGLGNGRGVRTASEVDQFFRRSVPRTVRNMGPKAVKEFVKGKQASHIESVANAPGKAKSVGNILWESSKRNGRRGSANMSRAGRFYTHAKNRMDAARIAAKGVVAGAAKGAGLAALMELPVTAAENTIHTVKRRISKQEAAKRAASDTATAAATGAAAGAAIVGAAAIGAGPAMATLAPVLAPVGITIYAISTLRRIETALRESQPLLTIPLYFHAGCVKREVGNTEAA